MIGETPGPINQGFDLTPFGGHRKPGLGSGRVALARTCAANGLLPLLVPLSRRFLLSVEAIIVVEFRSNVPSCVLSSASIPGKRSPQLMTDLALLARGERPLPRTVIGPTSSQRQRCHPYPDPTGLSGLVRFGGISVIVGGNVRHGWVGAS
jgi:hypothetical protein